jgi:hypothetical protein
MKTGRRSGRWPSLYGVNQQTFRQALKAPALEQAQRLCGSAATLRRNTSDRTTPPSLLFLQLTHHRHGLVFQIDDEFFKVGF